ncbi:ras and ef-hand domain-containing protein [Anaeramoeba flamelloides]|uniref:Ras and ef-hand domain-containing protein n=1 Tax=Anaeramoeba flamelloides TaxID=1746091 RepID=A0ABQ8YAK2_9EUKA|nr:ras and ef-hand domain-containing protein [Anaeramoeba flamelloides]
MVENFVLKFKVVLLGSSAVGKSSLVLRLCDNKFSETKESTIGAAFQNCSLDVGDTKVKLQIWDTAGQERYNSLTSMYYRGAKGAIIVFDCSNNDSFISAQNWVDEIRSKSSSNVKIIFVVNKTDLPQFKVDREEIEKFVNKNNLIFIETSAKTGLGVLELFSDLAIEMSEEYRSLIRNENNMKYYNDDYLVKKDKQKIILEKIKNNKKKKYKCC